MVNICWDFFQVEVKITQEEEFIFTLLKCLLINFFFFFFYDHLLFKSKITNTNVCLCLLLVVSIELKTHRKSGLLSAILQGVCVLKENNLTPILKYWTNIKVITLDGNLIHVSCWTYTQTAKRIFSLRRDLPVIWFWPLTIPIVRRNRTIVDIARRLAANAHRE